jgi:hypothetical protein
LPFVQTCRNKSSKKRISHPADLHQFTGLRFHAFGGVDYDNNAIDGGQRAISIFREILMSGCIQDIDLYPS